MCLLTYSPFWMSLKIISMRAVYLVLLNLSFLRMSVCLCLYAYCLLSIFKPFISACLCVCV